MRYDECSSYRIVLFVETKSAIPIKIKQLINLIKAETDHQVLKVYFDQGPEFRNHDLDCFFQTQGITHEFSNVYTPQQNGLIERENRNVIETARTILLAAKLSLNFWSEAVNTTVYILNRVNTSRNRNSTPYELWFGRKPSLRDLHQFGERAMVRIQASRKFSEKAEPMIFVGYTKTYNTLRFVSPKNHSLVISCDVTFMGVLHYISPSEEGDSPSFVKLPLLLPEQPISSTLHPNQAQTQKVGPSTDHPNLLNNDQDSTISSLGSEDRDNNESIYDVPSANVELRYADNSPYDPDFTLNSGERSNPPNQERLDSLRPQTNNPDYIPWSERENPKMNLSTLDADNDPKSFDEALSRTDKDLWLKAMDEEIASLRKNHVWQLVDRPSGKNIVTNRWVLRIKRKPSGEIERYRARLVARGFTQRLGQDYSETYAPVVNTTTVRLLFAYAASCQLTLAQFDIKTAFLYGELDEVVCMEQPQGYCHDKSKVCLLKRSLYGLKQAPRQWSIKFRSFLAEINLTQSEHDGCVFYSEDLSIIIAIYVDDGLILANNSGAINKVIAMLKSRFEVHTMELDTFLGFQIVKINDYLFVHQTAYINKILEKYYMASSKLEPLL